MGKLRQLVAIPMARCAAITRPNIAVPAGLLRELQQQIATLFGADEEQVLRALQLGMRANGAPQAFAVLCVGGRRLDEKLVRRPELAQGIYRALPNGGEADVGWPS